MKNNEKGFTLIESLFVLFIVLLFSAIAYNVSIQYSEKKVIDQFFNQLQLDILTAQSAAIELEIPVQVRFTKDNRYVVFSDYGFVNIERTLPKDITLKESSYLNRILFFSNGEVHDFGSLRFHTSDGEKVLLINIYKGRIRFG